MSGFLTQYFHTRKLKRAGKIYRFGSFKYTVSTLFRKKVVVDLIGVSRSQRSEVYITISSDEPGVFECQGKFLGITVDPIIFTLDYLAQKRGTIITFFGAMKVDVDKLLELIEDKFKG